LGIFWLNQRVYRIPALCGRDTRGRKSGFQKTSEAAMKNLTSILAASALVAFSTVASAQDATTETAEDDCEEQSDTDDDGCVPIVPIGGGVALGTLGGTGAAIGAGALVIGALALGSSGSHSGSH
jgi:hypothetical protein